MLAISLSDAGACSWTFPRLSLSILEAQD